MKKLISLSFLLLSACGQLRASDSSAASSESLSVARTSYGTCDRQSVPTINLCMEATGSDYNEPGYLQILQSSCESSGGTFSTAACTATASFGTCIAGAGQTNLTYVTYYAPTYDATSAKAACDVAAGIFLAH